MISLALRQRIIAAYTLGPTKTYEETAEICGNLRRWTDDSQPTLATLSRNEGGPKPTCGWKQPTKIDLDWLRKYAKQQSDARLIDRIEARKEASEKRV